MLYQLQYHSPLGMITLLANERCITGLFFSEQKHVNREILSTAGNGAEHPLLKKACSCLDAYFAGKDVSTWKLPLAPAGTPFQQAVWQLLLDIPYGQTVSYRALSARLAEQSGKKTVSPRAVGQAVGRNPISILIPCHRVIGADGSLTGYAGGIDRKISLLKLEGYLK